MSSQPPQGMPGGKPPGPPYPPKSAGVGGAPTNSVDTPISAVFIALFLVGAIGHMVIFRKNTTRGRKFIPSIVTFAFCMARIVANALRIAWANELTNVSLAIAAQVLVFAGVIILWIVNVLFAQRMLRAIHPRVGWSRLVSTLFRALYIVIILSLIMLIVAAVQTFYTLNPNTRRIDRDIRYYGLSFFTFISFLPLPILAFTLLASSRSPREPLGTAGRTGQTAQALIVGISGVLLTTGSGFRLGTGVMPPRPPMDPAWYQHKACFYVFNFGLEIIVVYLWLLGRIDQRFFVPDGSWKVRTYHTPEKGADAQHQEMDVGTREGVSAENSQYPAKTDSTYVSSDNAHEMTESGRRDFTSREV